MNDIKSTDDTSSEEANGTSAQSEEQQAADDNILDFTEIIFSAPFRTEVIIDSKKILGKYEDSRKEVQKKLSRTDEFSGWKIDPHIDKGSKNFGFMPPDKPGLTTLPPYFLGYKIFGEDIRNKRSFVRLQENIIWGLNCNNNGKQKMYFSQDNFKIIKAKLKFFEFGFGSIAIYGKLFEKNINFELLKSALESDKIKSTLDEFILEYIDEYKRSVSKNFRRYEEDSDQKYLEESGKVYWTHQLVSFVLDPKELSDNDGDNLENKVEDNVKASDSETTSLMAIDSSEDEVKKFYNEASRLLIKFKTINESEEVTQKNLNDKNLIFIPGTGNSMLLVKGNRGGENHENAKKQIEIETDSVSDMIAIAGTYSAFMHHFHDSLLYFVDKIIIKSDEAKKKKLTIRAAKKLAELSGKVSDKLHIYSHINFLLHEYETLYLSSIGKREFEKTKNVWKLNEQWDGIKQQIETLEKIYDRNDNIINRKQKTTLNSIAFAFTISTGFSSLGKVSLYKIKLDLFTIDSIEIDIVIMALLVVAILFYVKFCEKLKKTLKRLRHCIISFCGKLQEDEK